MVHLNQSVRRNSQNKKTPSKILNKLENVSNLKEKNHEIGDAKNNIKSKFENFDTGNNSANSLYLDSSPKQPFKHIPTAVQCINCGNMAKNFLYLEAFLKINTERKKCPACSAVLSHLNYWNKNMEEVFKNINEYVQATEDNNRKTTETSKPIINDSVNKTKTGDNLKKITVKKNKITNANKLNYSNKEIVLNNGDTNPVTKLLISPVNGMPEVINLSGNFLKQVPKTSSVSKSNKLEQKKVKRRNLSNPEPLLNKILSSQIKKKERNSLNNYSKNVKTKSTMKKKV